MRAQGCSLRLHPGRGPRSAAALRGQLALDTGTFVGCHKGEKTLFPILILVTERAAWKSKSRTAHGVTPARAGGAADAQKTPDGGGGRPRRPPLQRATKWLELLTATLSTSQRARFHCYRALPCWVTQVAKRLAGTPRSTHCPWERTSGKRTAAREPAGRGGCGRGPRPGSLLPPWMGVGHVSTFRGSPMSAEPRNVPSLISRCPPASPPNMRGAPPLWYSAPRAPLAWTSLPSSACGKSFQVP